MEIVNSFRRTVKFGDLPIGETFMREDRPYLYVKVMPMITEEGQTHINAVLLNDAAVAHFDNENMVIPVECKVEIIKEGW